MKLQIKSLIYILTHSIHMSLKLLFNIREYIEKCNAEVQEPIFKLDLFSWADANLTKAEHGNINEQLFFWF